MNHHPPEVMPFTVSLQFPAGRYAAASWGDKDSVEWPPHPARLCLALVDVLHKEGNPSDLREAVQWLCRQVAPEIVVPTEEFACEQLLDGIFVPQNPSVAEKLIKHPRKQRSFPSVFLDPGQPTVFVSWPTVEFPVPLMGSLSRLFASLPRLGHSSSFVIASVSDQSPPHGRTWRVIRPADSNEHGSPDFRMRVGWDGLVEAAETAYDAAGRAEELTSLVSSAERAAKPDKALKPAASSRGRHDPRHRWQGYTEGLALKVPSGYWDSRVLVLEQIDGDRIGLASTWQLAEVFHKTLLDRWTRRFGDQPPGWISGHRSGPSGEATAPSSECHLAVFPMAFVDAVHASGHLLGIGLAFPSEEVIGADAGSLRAEWRKAMAALFGEGEPLELTPRDRAWTVRLGVESSPKPRHALEPSRWIRRSKEWSTVTPIILDRHPKPHFQKDPAGWRDSCARIIKDACLRIGLPEPEKVSVSPHSSLRGVPSSSQFVAPSPRQGRPARFHIHATVHFSEEIAGPILLGAGRFRGYGLCLPINSKNYRSSDE